MLQNCPYNVNYNLHNFIFNFSIKNNKHIEHFYDFQALIIVNNIIPRGS